MGDSTPIKLRSNPGVKRDGTKFEGEHYIDAQWCRFQRGLPRKMGGFRAVTSDMAEIVYGMHSFSANMLQYMHLGSANLVIQRLIDNDGVQAGSNDRTPAITGSSNNIWQFDAIYDINQGTTVLLAHVAPNMNIASQDETIPWYGDLTAATTLVTTGADPVSGGVVVVGNYPVYFGNGGMVQWNTTANDVTSSTDTAFVTQQKIVRGLAVRGGGVPAALLWSLDTLLLMTFNDPTDVFWDFDTVGETSVLSSRGIIEYDGVYYWPGVDRFLAYNGVIREVPNQMNVNFFFDNLNFAQRQKVFAYKVPRFGEIWWCFPYGDAEECTHAVVYNVRENSWYDTELPNSGRSDGLYAKVYFKPFMTGVEQGNTGYRLWQHETGVNQVEGLDIQPIPSHFETAEFSLIAAEEPQNKQLEVGIIEPDFVQAGDLTMTVKGRANARAATVESEPVTITPQTDAGVDKDNQLVRVRNVKRLMSFKFETNTEGGDYQMGQPIAHIRPEGERMTQ